MTSTLRKYREYIQIGFILINKLNAVKYDESEKIKIT